MSQISITSDNSGNLEMTCPEKKSGKSSRSTVDRCDKGVSLLVALDDYVAIDVETTGLSPSCNEIIEFAAVRVRGGKVVDTYSSLCNPGCEIPHFVEIKTTITNGMVADAPPVKDVLFEFLHFIRDDTLVGHNVSFDVNFIYDSAMRHYGHGIDNCYVDTMRIARHTMKGLPSYSLGTVARSCCIENTQAHRALSDALCAHQLYEHQKQCFFGGLLLPECPVFGGYDYQRIFDSIQRMIGYDEESVKLRINKSGASIVMFGSLAFNVIINTKTQCLRTAMELDPTIVQRIPGASTQDGVTKIPLWCGEESRADVTDLVVDVYNKKLRDVEGEMIGCCDMFIMCSDALRCLRSNDPHYNGCLYRKNLEAGRIFYGKNKNI